MNVRAVKTRVFKEKEKLEAFILRYVPKLKNGSVLVVTSKIVALSEGRTADVRDKVKLIKQESDWAVKTKYVWLTMKNGVPMADAGIDSSNADGRLILLPKDSFKTARQLQKKLRKCYRIQDLGVVISDSRVFPFRGGVTGVALGYAGFKGVRDYRGAGDLFDRKFAYTKTDIADSIATAAVVMMGEGAERQPLCVIERAPVEFTDRVSRRELFIDVRDDMYRPLFDL